MKACLIMKRGTDHTWEIRKYIGDIALYAHCKCGYEYAASESERNKDGTWSAKQVINTLYHYCPWCGARKKWMTETIKWDKMRWE